MPVFSEPSRFRFFLRVVLPILFVTLVIAGITGLVVVWSSYKADAVAVERQEALAAHVVSQLRSSVAHEQESVTVWDDAVVAVEARRGDDWVDYNLGSWMNTYFGHDAAYIIDGDDEPFYASVGGEAQDASAYRLIREEAAPLVATLRGKLRSSSTEGISDRVLSVGASDLVTLAGRPAVVSAKPIISDTGELQQVPGRQFIHVAVRYIDGSYLTELSRDYLFDGLAFAESPAAGIAEASIPLANDAGSPIGHLVWNPYRPGATVLRGILPVLGIVLALALSVLIVLLELLRRRSTGLKDREAWIHHLAHHDVLTGLPNRLQLNTALDHSLQEIQRTGGQLAVVYLDLDHFKQVNDTLGHPAGDELIRQFADRLNELTRSGDTVGRIGGDEFTIILPDVKTQADAEALCQRVVESVRRPFDLDGNQVFVGVSVGMALAPDAGLERTEICRKADTALYHAKASGRSRYAVFSTEMDAILQTRRALELDLRKAIVETGQIEVHYQPLFSAGNRAITGVEALLRWRHPVNGWISPEVFIPLAEETGLIGSLGELVLHEACSAASDWPVETIAVNVSAVELQNPAYALKVAELLMATGTPASKLELELTESALTDAEGECARNVRALRELGVRIAIDDFGTGFSSLSRLQELKVDRIKIDRSFVNGFGSSTGDEAIVRAIINLAHATGLKTTGEGVETDAQGKSLEAMGCDELQGYLLARPGRRSEIDALFDAGPAKTRAGRRSV